MSEKTFQTFEVTYHSSDKEAYKMNEVIQQYCKDNNLLEINRSAPTALVDQYGDMHVIVTAEFTKMGSFK